MTPSIKTVVLPLGRNWTYASAHLAKRLQSEFGVECYGITHYLRWAREAERSGFPRDRIFYVNEEASTSDRPDLGRLAEIEARYGSPTLWTFLTADRHIGGLDYDELLSLAQGEFQRIIRFLEQAQPDAIVLDAVDRMGLLFLARTASERGIKVVVPSFARIPGRFIMTDNVYDRLNKVTELYESYKAEGLEPQLEYEASEFLRRFQEEKVVPSYASYVFRRPKLLDGMKQGARYVKDYYANRGPREYSSMPPLVHAAHGIRRVAAWPAARYTGLFDSKIPEGERNVLLPLQVHPEATLMVWAPHWLDQAGFVENAARSIPVGMKLYVKEHMAGIGTRPPGFYRRIKRLPNVRLLSPFLHPHDLIRATDLVVTINSTLGWEAALYGKPVITTGLVFYNDFDLIRHVDAPEELPGVIEETLRTFEPQKEAVTAFVAAVLAASHVGELDPGMPGFLDPHNLDVLTTALVEELGLEHA